MHNCFFYNAQDTQFEINTLQETSKIDVSGSSSMHSNNQNYKNYTDGVKTALNISKTFKGDKFGGKIGE